jgi:hypothetical protein
VIEETYKRPPQEERQEYTSEPESNKEWSWSAPDLSKESLWYRGRIRSLKKAIKKTANLPNAAHWMSEGKKALARHRTNYGVKGPQHLQP